MTDLRPYPAPKSPFLMAQTWRDLCFMHWRVDVDVLARSIPGGLELDLYQGEAWLGVVPFWMSDIQLGSIGMPVVGMTQFPELNVRTYVRHKGKPGVWFFSLDAMNRLAVRGARLTYSLPYFDAAIEYGLSEQWHWYRSRRVHANAPLAELQCEYRPLGEEFEATPGSLEDFLTSRYCLFARNRACRLLVGEIDHVPWRLQRAEASIRVNTMANWIGFELGSEPEHVTFSKSLDVRVWPIRAL